MSSKGKIAGYAEGPIYFCYAMENMLPFVVAYANFIQEDKTISYEYKGIYSPLNVRNFLYDPDFANLAIWLRDIMQPNGYLPAYDDSQINRLYPYSVATLQFKGKQNSDLHFNIGHPSNSVAVKLEADYLSNATVPQLNNTESSKSFSESGDLILQSPFSTNDSFLHYIRISGEKGAALNEGQSDAYGHEHPDVSSFIITAGKEILAIDPAYIKYDYRKNTNQSYHHNLIMVDRWWIFGKKGPENNTPATDMGDVLKVPSLQKSYVKTKYVYTEFERNIEMYKIDGKHYYYVMTDNVDRNRENPERDYIWCLNGNGNEDAGTFIPIVSNSTHVKWAHPCDARTNTWNLESITAVKGGNPSVYYRTEDTELENYEIGTENANAGDYICYDTFRYEIDKSYNWSKLEYEYDTTGETHYGVHTRLEVTKYGNQLTYLTVFWPYQCDETPPTMTKTEQSDYVGISINNINGDDVFHHAKLSDVTVNHTNPYNFNNCNAVLTYDAENAMLKLARNSTYNYGNCTVNTRFRIASIDNGTVLTYDDTTYISAADNVKTAYEIIGKFKYQGFIENNTGGNVDVTFFLPDCEPQYDMVATNLMEIPLTYSYNNGELKMTVTFPEGITNFYLTLADPC